MRQLSLQAESGKRVSMGCDIHAYVEVKIHGKWQLYSHLRLERDYHLFARMANVRNYYGIEAIDEPRGLPADISEMTRFCRDYDGADGHSDSYLSGAEVDALCTWQDKQRVAECKDDKWYSFEHSQVGYIFGNGWDVKKYPDSYPKGVEDARLVFWFDN